jgi:cyclin C
MSANYWTSSSYSAWTLPSTIHTDPKNIIKAKTAYCDLIAKLGKRMQCRQQVLATAITYFHRFFCTEKTGNELDSSPALLAATTCVYLATKVEENPQHIKSIHVEMKGLMKSISLMILFLIDTVTPFPFEIKDIAEFEFYLLETLQFYTVVYHPYRPLTTICKDAQVFQTI